MREVVSFCAITLAATLLALVIAVDRPGVALSFAPPRSLTLISKFPRGTVNLGDGPALPAFWSRSTRLRSVDGPLAAEGEWSAYLDTETTGLVYYHNARTGASRWEPPTRSFPVPKLTGRRERLARRRREEYRNSREWAEAKTERRDWGWLGGGWLTTLTSDGGIVKEAGTADEEATEDTDGSSSSGGWMWRGYSIHSEVIPAAAGSGGTDGCRRRLPPAALLVHGFGASTTYWRTTAAALSAAGFEVHALDLLGQGRSDKPVGDGVNYSVRLWAELVDDYAREMIFDEGARGGRGVGWVWGSGSGSDRRRELFLVGHSLGSLVCLATTVGDHIASGSAGGGRGGFLSRPGRVTGICMFNCGVGMNTRGIVDDPRFNVLQRAWIQAAFAVTDVLVLNKPPVLRLVLHYLVTRDFLRSVLRGLYRYDPDRVDNALVESFYRPTRDEPGAAEAVRQIYTNDPGLTPMELFEKHSERLELVPLHLIWGNEDEVTALSGSVGRFYTSLAQSPEAPGVSMDVVRAGHIPFDDNPVASNGSMLRWMGNVRPRCERKRTWVFALDQLLSGAS